MSQKHLFAKSYTGAKTGRVIITILETAKANRFDPWRYMNYLLTHLPNEFCLIGADLSKYLSWSHTVQQVCADQIKKLL
ncbi:hypothetical protein CL176_02415 [Suicoccus acidiformans]|uniref:Transposase IS66 C-terminal domain-containing protein n=1 Tax=Suicoccus acidiformans TaxID=2036206 RepID=A0A347WIR3_9LACT|nr:transposase domain-containing protein [Suicoccus acidiformans]AXY24970.1 hypothetical protein CL176_02415 [Suicoccus acidiformans]